MLIGWQIVEVYTDNPPRGMSTFEVYPLEDCLRWLTSCTDSTRVQYRLLPVYDGDIQKPEHCFL